MSNFCLYKSSAFSKLSQNELMKQQRAKNHDKIIRFRHRIFLLRKHNVVIHCARVIMNFVTLIQYTFHDENTLNYMKHALYRMNNLKTVFVKYKFQNTVRNENDENKMHFNIFKFHVMTHYMTFIRLYNSVQDFDTVYEETIYKFLLKIFFVMINRVND